MNLTEHFTLEELCESDTAIRKGIDNIPDANIIACLQLLAPGLERVRAVLGVPMRINSGYRSPKLNAAVGGAKSSAHVLGLAADFTAPMYGDPRDVCHAIMEHSEIIGFDKLIYEGTWVHVSFPDGDDPLLETLTARFEGGSVRYERGIQ